MNYSRLISLSAAVLLTGGLFTVVAPPALTLNRRVGGAVGSLCREATGGEDGNFMTTFADRKCRNSAWSQARPQIARAVQRSRDIAFTGTSPIAAAAITINLTK